MQNDQQRLNDKDSQTINILRVISILSVITAHVSSLRKTSIVSEYLTSFLKAFGCVGVICFFVIGGFLYKREKGDDLSFWSKKIKRIIIPWVVCSLLTYFVKIITDQQVEVIEYLKWVFGFGTWYYYTTVYLIFMVLFKWIQKDIFLYISIGLNVLSLTLCTFFEGYMALPFVTPYLNIFNWIGFFALGILVRKYRIDHKILKSKIAFSICFVFVLVGSFVLQNDWEVGYFGLFSAFVELSMVVCCLYIAKMLLQTRFSKYCFAMSRYVYTIYLLHMPIVQPICNRMPDTLLFDLLNPIIGFLVMIILIFLGEKICSCFPWGSKLYRMIGVRR